MLHDIIFIPLIQFKPFIFQTLNHLIMLQQIQQLLNLVMMALELLEIQLNLMD